MHELLTLSPITAVQSASSRLDFARKASVVAVRGEAAMNDQRKELVSRLFVIATELLEDAHEIAIGGQSPKLNARGCVQAVDRLRETAADLTTLANAAILIAKPRKG